jgi:hypothetical protein
MLVHQTFLVHSLISLSLNYTTDVRSSESPETDTELIPPQIPTCAQNIQYKIEYHLPLFYYYHQTAFLGVDYEFPYGTADILINSEVGRRTVTVFVFPIKRYYAYN